MGTLDDIATINFFVGGVAFPNKDVPDNPSSVLAVPLARYTASMANNAFILGVNLTVAVPIPLPSDVTRVRFLIDNGDAAGLLDPGPEIPNVDIAWAPSNGAGGYASTPTVLSNITIPPGGASYDSGWRDVTRGADGKITLALGIPIGSTIHTNALGLTLYNGLRSISVKQVNPLPVLIDSGSTPLTIRVVYETTRPRIVICGDSQSVGWLIDTPGLVSSFGVKMGIDNNWSVDASGIPGVSCDNWNTRAKLSYGMYLAGATVLQEAASINDLPTVAALATYTDRVQARTAQLRALGVARVIWMTLTPSVTYIANNAMRNTINTDLRARYLDYGIAGLVDADLTLRDPATPSQLLAAYDAGEGTHFNSAGHAALATACADVIRPLVA